VSSRNLENEEAKARYRAVKNTTAMGCDVRKTNNFITQANGFLLCSYIVEECGNVKWPQVTVLTETSTM
jgi:hypothetical protein